MEKLTCKDFNEVLAVAKTYIKNDQQLKKIEIAYEYALKKHGNQVRKNGDPYVYHLLSTAYNLTLWHLDPASIQAGFLHDILEDTPTTFEELSNDFGSEIANLVLAVTKVSHFAKENRQEIKSTYLRKLYLSLADDVRVIIIKMADRLHNIRTIKYLNSEKQKIIARETLEVYSSIAHRLGMRKLQAELEDLSFEVLYPKEYKRVSNLVNLDRENRENLVNNTIIEINKILHKRKDLEFRVYGRSKSLFSIYRKMYHFGKNFDEIHDILAIRIVCKTIDQCYSILGYLHQKFLPLPRRFKDYIATPKNNIYQSLHTSIIFQKEIYELQIRTEEMEDIAEVGAAAHWRYKEGEVVSNKKKQEEIDEKLNLFQTILDLNAVNNFDDDSHNLEKEIKQDLFSELIYVLTPNGNVITLPLGSTVLDFAYKIHTEIGDKTMGARVNGIYCSINTVLKTGDIVEIKTSNIVKPNYAWLNIAKTNFARHKIKKFLNRQDNENKIDNKNFKQLETEKKIGLVKEKIDKYVLENKLRWRLASASIILNRLKYLKYSTYEDFCLAIANGTYSSIEEAVNSVLFSDSEQFKNIKKQKSTKKFHDVKNDIVIDNGFNIKTSLANCCLPIPDEKIIGFITKGQGIKIHRSICSNVVNDVKQERVLPASWNLQITSNKLYNSAVKIYYLDRLGLLSDIINIFAQLKVQIDSIDGNNKLISNKGSIKIYIKVPSVDKLNQIISSIKKIPDIIEVNRIVM